MKFLELMMKFRVSVTLILEFVAIYTLRIQTLLT